MKKLIFILLASIFMIGVANAQKAILKNGDERFTKSLRTTDSTFRSIDSCLINTNEAGIIEVKVVGLDTANKKAVTGLIVARYVSVSGTITLSSTQEISTITTDSGLSPATFKLVSSGSKIYLQVKGKLTVSVHWISTLKRNSIYKSS